MVKLVMKICLFIGGNMKKKLIGLICVLAITSSFIACGGDKKDDISSKAEASDNIEVEESEKDDAKKKGEKETEKETAKNKLEEEEEKASSDKKHLEEFGLDIEIPSKWELLSDDMIEAMGGNATGANLIGLWIVDELTGANFAIATDNTAPDASLADYRVGVELILGSQEGIEPIINEKKYGDVEALEVRYKNIGVNITQIVIKSEKDFVLIMYTEPADKESNFKEFEKVIESLKEI